MKTRKQTILQLRNYDLRYFFWKILILKLYWTHGKYLNLKAGVSKSIWSMMKNSKEKVTKKMFILYPNTCSTSQTLWKRQWKNIHSIIYSISSYICIYLPILRSSSLRRNNKESQSKCWKFSWVDMKLNWCLTWDRAFLSISPQENLWANIHTSVKWLLILVKLKVATSSVIKLTINGIENGDV